MTKQEDLGRVFAIFANWRTPEYMATHLGKMNTTQVKLVQKAIDTIAFEVRDILCADAEKVGDQDA